ncbi:putative zinc-ribbon domain protein [Fadolivirus algeromassiliense]|jgi:very-short-patch-repair endonuclease|uniref:Zinc-ribbon domain protein n=1 Tax=Fadolivirus FV1/VV64 TaxID=3070911 RepID=A0A7D3QUW1_9VIRU|nr:putative zinc-ribbon domain protein [Fadolivirus algeromassiliense]QKF94507.1 putative zinc-ribbon domain protein [Fadolivirus FV1/VV64]
MKTISKNDSLLAKYPKLCEEWDYEKNDIKPEDVYPTSEIKVWWICKNENNCGCHKWQTRICNRTRFKNGCPYCSNSKACKHTSLLTKYPKLCEEWDYKNNEVKPNEILPGSSYNAWWVCNINKCGCHKWQALVSSRTGKYKSGCPYCAVKNGKACNHTSLLALHPELCQDWDYERNEINPNEILPGSSLFVWWKCSKASCDCHRWKTRVDQRTNDRKIGCPYCSNKKVCIHNSLLWNYPQLCVEWYYTKNEKLPCEYTPGSGTKVWWKCQNNSNHIWKSNIYGRTCRDPHGCPICKFSRGEQKIINTLDYKKINYISQKTFENCIHIKQLPFDFYLTDYNLIIEFDGVQHFQPMKFCGGERDFVDRHKKDNIKNKFCKDNKINLIRISYKQINKIENIIDELLNKMTSVSYIVYFSDDILYTNMKQELEKVEHDII